MDSGNTGSLRSSSGGDATATTAISAADEVHDSRQESLFLNPSMHFNHLPPGTPPTTTTFFDPTSFSQPYQNPNPNPNQMYNLESLWSRNTKPNQNPIYNFDSRHDPIYNPNPNPVGDNINPDTGPEKGKNPKKRTRASRKAPTTVLTTDTTNFRQMVQEFTGIPAVPFSTASTSSTFSRRMDLYGGGVTPVQKIQLQQQPSYLNSVNTSSTSNSQLPPQEIQGFAKQPLNLSNLSNVQNQMFSFQSGSQTNLSQRSEPSNESPKRWRSENEHLVNFEGGNINNINNQNAGVSSRSDHGDHPLQGNEDSWICASD